MLHLSSLHLLKINNLDGATIIHNECYQCDSITSLDPFSIRECFIKEMNHTS